MKNKPSISDIEQLVEIIVRDMTIMHIAYMALVRIGEIASIIHIDPVNIDRRNVDDDVRIAWELYLITQSSDIRFFHHQPRTVRPRQSHSKHHPHRAYDKCCDAFVNWRCRYALGESNRNLKYPRVIESDISDFM